MKISVPVVLYLYRKIKFMKKKNICIQWVGAINPKIGKSAKSLGWILVKYLEPGARLSCMFAWHEFGRSTPNPNGMRSISSTHSTQDLPSREKLNAGFTFPREN
jgi:hypothetical protein